MTANFPQADMKEQGRNVTPLQVDEWKPLLMVGGFFFTVCMALVLHRHFTFYSSYDQGIFNQVMWNGVQGNFFQSSLSSQLSTNVVHAGEMPDVSYHRLGQHFTPALLLWLPFYSWFPQAATLSVLLVTVISAAGLVLYVLARQYLEPTPARWITFSYYGAHAVIGPTLCNFHDNFQLPLFMFTLLLAMEKRWWWLFALMCPLILAVREDTGIALFGVGMYMILSRRFPRIGAIVCLLSFGYILALTNLIMPLFSDDISKRFMLEQFGQYTDAEEASTLDIIRGMLMNPGKLAIELVTPFSLTFRYIIAQWLPLMFVPVVAPTSWIIAGFPLLKLLVGQTTSLLSINVRYAIALVPGLCYGAILWWSGEGFNNFFQPNKPRQPRSLSRVSKRVWAICLSTSIFLAIAANPNRTLYFIVPDAVEPWVYVSPLQQWQRSREIYQVIGQIPDDASVAATTYIVPHLSSRREIIRSPFVFIRGDNGQVETVDYLVADLWRLVRYQSAFDEDRESLNIHVDLINHLLATSQYGVTEFINGVILMQKGVNSVPQELQEWQEYEQSIQPILNQPQVP